MASISVVCAPPSALLGAPRSLFLRPDASSLLIAPIRRRRRLQPPHCMADLSRSSSGPAGKKPGKIEHDPIHLCKRYADWLYQNKELNLSVDVSRIGFTNEFVRQIEPKFRAMQELENMAIANPGEGRMVGHYWLRSPNLAPTDNLKSQIESTLDAVCKFADDIVSAKITPPSSAVGRFTQILSIGIGGSVLPRFVDEAMAHQKTSHKPPLKIRFVDNTDPADIGHQIEQLGVELDSTLVIVISESGVYPETRLLEVQRAFRKAKLDFAKQAVAITQENTLLDDIARTKGWLARFPMFDWMGDRNSMMSAFSLLPAALQKIDIKKMLKGAALMVEATQTTELKKNPAALLAMCWYWASNVVGSKEMVVLSYDDSLLLFSQYLQQLVMEYHGKEFNLDGNRVNQGLTVYGNKESIDQYAYIQQLSEGVHNFFVTFIEVLQDWPPRNHENELEQGVTCRDYLFGMLQGTRSSLYANDRESITVTVKEVNCASLGALIALYERAVGIYASLLNINAHPKSGLEVGKKAAKVLTLQKTVLEVLNEATCNKSSNEPADKPLTLTLKEIADRCHATEEIEIIYMIIVHLAMTKRVLIMDDNYTGSPLHIEVLAIACPRDNKNS